MLVTPAMAKHWLETANVKNRPVSEMHWMKIWLDIVEGRWKYNGEPISFGTNSALLNGQHRLRACAESEIPIDTDVIFGLDPEVMSTIDIGKVRTAANIAYLDGVENATAACAAAHLILLHENGGIQQLGNKGVEPSKTKVNERVRNDRRISTVAGHATGMGRGLASPRVMTFCYYLFSAQKSDLAESFLNNWRAVSVSLNGIPSTSCGSACAPTAQARQNCRCSKSSRSSSRRGSLTEATSQ